MPSANFDTCRAPVQPVAMDRRRLPSDSGLPIGLSPARAGLIPGTAGHAAFTIVAAEPSALPVVIAAPHGGRTYPDAVLAQMRDPGTSQLRLEDRLVDRLGEAVVQVTGAALLVAHAPRAMIDLNRAPDDIDWGMVVPPADGHGRYQQHPVPPRGRARHGLGLVPRRLPGTGEIWTAPLDRAELERRINAIHAPYHQALAEVLAEVRDRWGAVLLVDLHSMPPITGWAGTAVPEFVIGDRFGAACSGALVAHAFGWFARAGRAVAHNRPYAGGYVLERHAAPRRGIHGLQIETDRRCYLDPELVSEGAGFDQTVDLLAGLIAELAVRVAELGAARSHAWPQAAE